MIHLALASIVNACFDLWAKARGVPLWRLLLDLNPEQLVALLDLSYVDDELSEADALAGVCLHRTVELRPTRLVVYDWPGYGDAIVHILTADSSLARRIAAAFAPEHRVLSIVLSDDSPYQVPADSVRRVLDQFGLSNAIVIAEGSGALIAMTIAAWWPARVRAFVLVDPQAVEAPARAIRPQVVTTSRATVVADIEKML